MSNENIERRIEFIIEQQAKFSADIEQLKEVQAQQAESINNLTTNVHELTDNMEAMRVEMREGFNNLIVANEVTRKLAEDVARLTVQNSQRITRLEEKAS
jgi:hypothetical protein